MGLAILALDAVLGTDRDGVTEDDGDEPLKEGESVGSSFTEKDSEVLRDVTDHVVVGESDRDRDCDTDRRGVTVEDTVERETLGDGE